MLLVGIFAPMMTLTKFVWIDNSFSLFAGTLQLFVDGQYFLFIILLTFSILLPVAKLILLLRFWYADSSSCDQLQHFMNWISHYGKWSMLDVFVVALLLVMVPAFMLPLMLLIFLPRLGRILATSVAGGLVMMFTNLSADGSVSG